MQNFQIFLYNIAIRAYYLAILVASLFNEKAALWIKGRKVKIEPLEGSNFWVHCASLGEFEQAKPLIKKIKNHFPHYKIIVTFFSPSGYEIQKNNSLLDKVYYLPIDSAKNAQNIISNIQPKAVFFVKYEFWYHYLSELKNKNIPTFLIAGIFRPNQIFFKSYDVIFKKMLQGFTHIFVQNSESKNLLANIEISKVSIANDTRFDTVYETFKNAKKFKEIERFIGNKKCIVIGSSWLKDEKIWSQVIADYSDFKFIIAPHDVNSKRIAELNENFSDGVLHSNLNTSENAQILIIDSIGKLSNLYQYAYITYIGGGFDTSVHNVLEPAVFGTPIIFGLNHHKSQEAKDLVNLGGAFSISDKNELKITLDKIIEQEANYTAALISKKYVHERIGGTNKIINQLIDKKYL